MSASPINFYSRILLVSLLVVLLGLAPHPLAADEYLINANKAIARGELLDASRDLAHAALYFPWRYELNIAAGYYALEAGDAKSAILYLERPGTLSHLTYDDKILLGDAYFENDDPLMAEAIWKHLSYLSDSSQVHERLLNLYLLRKDYASVISQLQKLLELNPSNTDLYYKLGSLYAATDPMIALPYLIQAAEMDTKDASNARLLHDKIRTANLFDNPAYTYLLSGRQLANSGNWELAEIAFQHAIEVQPGYADAWAFLGEARWQLAEQEEGSISAAGLYELDRALQLDRNSILANTFMGLYWERQEDYTRAQSYLEHAIALSPDDPYLYSELGNILSKAGDLPAAQSAYQKAIQINPQDPLFYRMLAEFALQNEIQIRELALPAARQAITLNPDDVSSLDLMGQVMLALQDYHSAERFLLDALQANPEFSPAYLHLGTAYLYLGESELASQWLNLAQTVDPESWIAAQAKRILDYYFP
jgi:tetratricopeptide (TPR) repeat protein